MVQCFNDDALLYKTPGAAMSGLLPQPRESQSSPQMSCQVAENLRLSRTGFKSVGGGSPESSDAEIQAHERAERFHDWYDRCRAANWWVGCIKAQMLCIRQRRGAAWWRHTFRWVGGLTTQPSSWNRDQITRFAPAMVEKLTKEAADKDLKPYHLTVITAGTTDRGGREVRARMTVASYPVLRAEIILALDEGLGDHARGVNLS